MTATPTAPAPWSVDLCQADSGCRAGGVRASSALRFHGDGVGQLLFDVGGVGHDQYLTEPGAEAGQSTEEAIAVLAVERAEHLVEHQQADSSAGQQVDLFADGDAQRQVGQVSL